MIQAANRKLGRFTVPQREPQRHPKPDRRGALTSSSSSAPGWHGPTPARALATPASQAPHCSSLGVQHSQPQSNVTHHAPPLSPPTCKALCSFFACLRTSSASISSLSRTLSPASSPLRPPPPVPGSGNVTPLSAAAR